MSRAKRVGVDRRRAATPRLAAVVATAAVARAAAPVPSSSRSRQRLRRTVLSPTRSPAPRTNKTALPPGRGARWKRLPFSANSEIFLTADGSFLLGNGCLWEPAMPAMEVAATPPCWLFAAEATPTFFGAAPQHAPAYGFHYRNVSLTPHTRSEPHAYSPSCRCHRYRPSVQCRGARRRIPAGRFVRRQPERQRQRRHSFRLAGAPALHHEPGHHRRREHRLAFQPLADAFAVGWYRLRVRRRARCD